jgi:hypothetical protein
MRTFAVIALGLLAGCARPSSLDLPADGPGPELRITAPAGCTVETRRGPDFRVHHLACPDGRLGIYLGPHPGPHHLEGQTLHDGLLAGRKVQWSAWTEDPEGEPRYHREAVIPSFVGQGDEALSLHVFAFGQSEGAVERLADAAASIAVVR